MPMTRRVIPRFGHPGMMGSVRDAVDPLDPVADLKRRLGRAAPRYRRVIARARGLALSTVRTCVRVWWRDHELGDHPATVGKRIALALLEQPIAEDKLAGILVLQEMLGDQLRGADLPAFARLFADGHLADGDLVDGFCVRVLVTLLDREPGRAEVVRGIAQWRNADTMWQRRAACVSFTSLAARGDRAVPGVTAVILGVCATVVWSHERFDQTAVGWVLRELGRAQPVRVEGFFRRHAHLMSRECARMTVARLPAARRGELLTHHKRVTTIARR